MQALEIHTRTQDTATVDGQLVHRGHYETIYDAALGLAINYAQDEGTAVLAKAIDGVGGSAVFWIQVNPDGSVETAQPPADQPDSPQVQPAATGTGRHTDFDEADFYTPAPYPPTQTPHRESVEMPTPPAPPVHSRPSPPSAAAVAPTPEQPAAAAVPSWPARSSEAAESPPPQRSHHRPVEPGTSPTTGPRPVLRTQDNPAEPPAQPSNAAAPATPSPATPVPKDDEVNALPQQQQQHQQQPAQPFPHIGHPTQRIPAATPRMNLPAAPPSLTDLRASRPDLPEAPADTGWRGNLRRLTGGLLKLPPCEAELRNRRAKDAVQRSLRGPRTVVVVNTKGGGGKTTAVYSLAATFGQARGGYVLGWDNNETRGTLAWRAAPARHTNTAVDLLRDLQRFEDPRNARVGDLDNYVRAQGSAQFDVLASDENAASAASIDDDAFRALHRSLSRFYRILVIDTGNNVKAPNWGAAVDLADQLVIVSSIREDTAGGASWTLDHLMEIGLGPKVANAVTILSAPKQTADPDQRAMHIRFREHFTARTRTVLDVPFDAALVDGDSIDYDALSPATRQAWLHAAAAAIAEGL